MSKLLSDELCHKQGNKKGSLWGYSYGIPNGKRKKGEKGDTVQTQSNAEYVPSESIEEWPGGAKIHRLTSPKTYEEYRSQGKSIIENFFEERRKTVEMLKKVEPIGKKEFSKTFNVWR